MSIKKVIFICTLLIIFTFVYVYLLTLPQEYKTQNECEMKTGLTCFHDFGDYLLPHGFWDSIKAKWCLMQVPSGWAPAKYFPSCVWPND